MSCTQSDSASSVISCAQSVHCRSSPYCCCRSACFLDPNYISTVVELPIIHKPNRIYCSCANRPYMVPTAKCITMNAAGAEGGAIQGLTTLPSLACLIATVRTGLTRCLKRNTQSCMLHAPRAERSKGSPVLLIKASCISTLQTGLTRCLKCNTIICGQQGCRLSDPRAHLRIKPSRSYSHTANRTYMVPEAQ